MTSSELDPRTNSADIDVADIGIIFCVEREVAELEIQLRGVIIKILHDGNPESLSFIVIRFDIFRVTIIYTESGLAEIVQRSQPADLAPQEGCLFHQRRGCTNSLNNKRETDERSEFTDSIKVA